MKTIDTKGKACQDPVVLTKAEVDRGETELEVLLDNPVSASDVMRLLENKGFSVQLKDDEGAITISARRGEQSPKAVAFKKQPASSISDAQSGLKPQTVTITDPESSGTFSVLITSLAIGSDRQLGEALMKSFLATLPQMERHPLTVALMNEGVKLALYDSSSCDHLKSLEKKGVSILVCGTCANQFNVMDQIGAGSISNMLEIMETLNKADKILTL